jgi:O-antigen/teichoic acid export membrane protein
MSNILNSQRIVKNTLFLYFRVILTLVVTLYTSRVILNTLGIEDFGIFNVVGGVVTMMSFLSGAMSSATQRFLSYELGRNDAEQLHNVFRMSLNIHLLIIIIVLLVAESVGLWFINHCLIISTDRLDSANIVFHCALFSFCCAIISVPYTATIISHERMGAFAYISIADVTLKLVMVLMLTHYGDDKLKLYALLLALVSFIMFVCYYLYARTQFPIATFNLYWNNNLFITLLGYTGWNLFGNLAAVATNQGVNVLLNIFFGAPINAARGIAFQVNSAITNLVGSLQMAINPQIVKSYANNNHEYMRLLIFSGARYSFFLLFMIALPLLLQTDLILQIWLGELPKYASDFCRLVIVDSLIVTLSGTLMTAFQATGEVKKYQIVVGCTILFNLPLSYAFLSFGCDAVITMLISIAISILALCARVVLLSKLFSNVIRDFFDLICKILYVFVPSICMSLLLPTIDDSKVIAFFVSCLSYWLLTFVVIFFIGINQQERKFLISKLKIIFKVSC